MVLHFVELLTNFVTGSYLKKNFPSFIINCLNFTTTPKTNDLPYVIILTYKMNQTTATISMVLFSLWQPTSHRSQPITSEQKLRPTAATKRCSEDTAKTYRPYQVNTSQNHITKTFIKKLASSAPPMSRSPLSH